jgi:hypothetical protein
MGQAPETLAQQSRVVSSIIFCNLESFSYRMGEEHFPNAMELEELPRQDEDKIDRFKFLQ